MLYLTKSPENCERHNGSTLAVASEASQVLGNAVSGVWSESGTTADRIARIEESAKHGVSDSLIKHFEVSNVRILQGQQKFVPLHLSSFLI